MSQNKHVFIVGAGAIGSLFGWKLSKAGFKVTIAAHSDIDMIKEKGISIQSIWGNDLFFPYDIVSLEEKRKAPIDFIIVCTKALPGLEIHLKIKHLIEPKTSLVLLQNGIGIEERYNHTFPKNHIISGLAFVCATKIRPGTIEHKDYGRLVFGDYMTGLSEKTEELIHAFKSVEVPCKGSKIIQKERWKKLLWNAPFNPISVISGGLSTKEILENDDYYTLTKKVMIEVSQIASKDGYPLKKDAIKRNIEDTKVMIPYKTSMLIDFEKNRPLEIEAILGNAIKLGEKYDIKTPHMNHLYQSLKEITAPTS